MKIFHVSAAVIRRNGQILLCGRKPDAVLSCHYEFPGGKAEPGETLSKCLRREMREELGTDVFVLDQLGENRVEIGDRIYHLHFLRAVLRPDAPEPVPQEGQPMFWAAAGELDQIRMLPGDVRFAKWLADSEKSGKNSDLKQ